MLKLISDTDRIKLAHPGDPAIDRKKSDLKKYRETGEIGLLTFKELETPTFFHVAPLSATQGEDLDEFEGSYEYGQGAEDGRVKGFRSKINTSSKAIKAFRFCVREITGIENLNMSFESDGHNKLVSRKVLEILERNVVVEIGNLILKVNSPKEDDEKN